MTIAAIRQFLKHPDCIIFVGSGISTWSNIPGWSGLLEELATFLDDEGQSSELVRREIRNGDLLQAASFGVSKLTPTSFGTFIRNAVRVGATTPHVIHKAIVELGPTGFITTNYDTLIEQALGTWRTDAFFPAPVTNKHLVELVDTVRARSSHFIFKPHGDINDISSVILTREQYRTLMPGGERQSALETLKMLLMTRPVLYVGFGLRDPDFIYLRDLLLNIYQGAVRDHWAIMPDTGEEEADYWRRQYGIKLFGYETHKRSDGSRDHRELLSVLQSLAEPHAITAAQIGEPSEAERVLAVTRYSSGLVRRLTPKNTPITVRISETRKNRGAHTRFGNYENWTTTRFLTEGPHSAYLIGLPGSGKSFAMRLAALQLASKVQQACIDDTLASTPLTIPILLDLKLYQGDLRTQINAELPAGLTLSQLRRDLGLKLFLDAFNEMPSEYLEDGTLFKSLDEIKSEIGDFSYAITSRTSDGLSNRLGEIDFYEIDRFELHHVDAVLAEHNIKLSGRFAKDVRYLLSRPFFLQLVTKRLVEVPENATPRDLFASFMTKLQLAFDDRFKIDLQLLPIFAKLAYRAIESESEAFPLTWLSDLLAMQAPGTAACSASDVVNWLIAREILIPYTGRRASFVHQSITEYCAAIELVRRSRTDTLSVRDTIASKKWDQCLFLALALMEPATAKKILSETIKADFMLAINAVRYAEEGQSAAVTELLEELINLGKKAEQEQFPTVWLSELPVDSEHVELLKQLVLLGDTIAGEAVLLIAQVLGAQFKQELLDLLEAHADDFNLSVNGIAPALKPLIDETDLERLMLIGEKWIANGENDDHYFAVSQLMASFQPKTLFHSLQQTGRDLSPGMADLLAAALSERDDDESFAALADLLLEHSEQTASSFSFSLQRHRDEADTARYNCLDHRHIDAIWCARTSQSLWDHALSQLCLVRSDLTPYVEQMAAESNGIEAIALLYCCGLDNQTLLAKVEELLELSDADLKLQPFEIFEVGDLEWRGRETLLVQSLAREIPMLRQSLVSSSNLISGLAGESVNLAIMKPIIELVEDLQESSQSWWISRRLGPVVAHLGDMEVRTFCLNSLVHGSEPIRHWLKTSYLSSLEGLTSDALNDDMIATLLADLNVPKRISEYWYNPLGYIATDRFVQERLLPLVESASTTFLDNLEIVLRAVGERHGKRYLLPK
ncbi:hypothetical protein M2418_002073 [Rhizobium sp. BIGb0125]|uniref:SIR2 family NAD-dependent protein deacylase n=1 Tax=Rhizobium sp. BIGb0125 TaxID=2940618 RepID=UPI00216A4149|nr:SIR2 family protein [Rhizobium sp. BIGb0125]MCS4242547.1 hypothetical protein [Rhizobium sp. BIGb0125]